MFWSGLEAGREAWKVGERSRRRRRCGGGGAAAGGCREVLSGRAEGPLAQVARWPRASGPSWWAGLPGTALRCLCDFF